VETNPPRNNWPRLIETMTRARGETGSGLAPRTKTIIGLIDLLCLRKLMLSDSVSYEALELRPPPRRALMVPPKESGRPCDAP
jgi:hypothetical protein